MTSEYVHQKLGEDIHALAGYYTPEREERLKYNGREVLYTVGGCTVESSCCGGATGCMGYVIVPGYLVSWQSKRNKEGLPVSEVTLIKDKETQQEITRIIQEKENARNISFW
jgi:hypothetical protein